MKKIERKGHKIIYWISIQVMPKWLRAEATAAQTKGQQSIYKPENQEEEDCIQPRGYTRL